jgi:predicted membrane chloride channel (bestrophin family)
MATLYVDEVGTARLNRILRLLAAFPYLLRLHVQPGRVNSNVIVVNVESESVNGQSTQQEASQQVVDRQVLPWCLLPPTALQKCMNSSNRPLWICDRLSEELQNVDYTDNYTSRERLVFLSQIGTLSKSVGECERIHQTAVPLNYARHSLRSLTFWLLTLPFCLVGELHLLTAPVMGAIAWLMLGVYQIGYTIEDPFQGSLRLRVLCDAIYRDVMTGNDGTLLNRQSAFEIDNDEVEEWSEMPPEPSLP